MHARNYFTLISPPHLQLLIVERIMALQQKDWEEKHIFVYLIESVMF